MTSSWNGSGWIPPSAASCSTPTAAMVHRRLKRPSSTLPTLSWRTAMNDYLKFGPVQYKRLMNVAKALRESPNAGRFDMGCYIHSGSEEEGEKNWCGSPACALGHYG